MIDLLLLALIAVSALLGLMRGMLAAVFGVLSWLLASWAALRFGRDATLFISGGDAPTLAQYATGHAVAFFAVLLAVTGVGLLLRGVVNATVLLKGPDRLLGLVLGTARGVLLAVLAVLVLGFTPLAEGEDVDMGTPFDWFGTQSHTDDTTLAPDVQHNRRWLRTLLQRHGFRNLPEEWWHYTLNPEPHADRYFNFPVR